jgi:hypothetical protein
VQRTQALLAQRGPGALAKARLGSRPGQDGVPGGAQVLDRGHAGGDRAEERGLVAGGGGRVSPGRELAQQVVLPAAGVGTPRPVGA